VQYTAEENRVHGLAWQLGGYMAISADWWRVIGRKSTGCGPQNGDRLTSLTGLEKSLNFVDFAWQHWALLG
jgi:hypothetical protein